MDILLVDDDDTLRQSLKMLLELEGYNVQEASSGEKALEKARLHYFDLVLSDVRMPGIDGIETVSHLKESIHDAHFVVMTGYASEEAPIQALRLGVDDYITKPFDIPLFLEKIRGVARRRRQATKYSSASLCNFPDSLKDHFPALADHCSSVVRKSQRWAQALALSPEDRELLQLGAWLHPLSRHPGDSEACPNEDSVSSGLSDDLAVLLNALRGTGPTSILVDILQAAICQLHGEELPDKMDTRVQKLAEEDVDLGEKSPETARAHDLEVLTLGRFEVRIKGKTIDNKAWQSANARWVFVYLLSRGGQSVPEDRLAEMFWPASPPEKAHRALVSSVHRARKALEDSGVLVRYDKSYGVSRELDYSLDSQELIDAYKAGVQHFSQKNFEEAQANFLEVMDLYQGHYLPDCHDLWCKRLREDLKHKTADAAQKLARIFLDSEPNRAEEFARKALSIERTSEPAWSVLFKALSALGRRAEVETAYRDCADTLNKELQLKPGASLKDCYAECME